MSCAAPYNGAAQPGRKKKPSADTARDQRGFDFLLQNSRPAVLSFLKDMRGVACWTTLGLIRTLNISEYEADKILAILQFHEYINRSDTGEWLTTASGQTASGSKQPRL